MSGVELFGLELFGVEVEDGLFGLVVLLGLVEFGSVLVVLELGEVDVLLLELDGDVEFMSELLDEGAVVEEGELEVLDPAWLDELDGLCVLLAPLPALLCAIARPVEKMTAVAIVRSFLLIRDFSPERWLASYGG